METVLKVYEETQYNVCIENVLYCVIRRRDYTGVDHWNVEHYGGHGKNPRKVTEDEFQDVVAVVHKYEKEKLML